MESLLNRHFHLIFIGIFFTLSGLLLFVPPIWDEGVYLQLATHVLSSPFNPFHPMLSWVPHPPLLWYLMAIFYPLPRMAPLLTSTICISLLFYVCKRLYGNDVARLSVVVLVSTFDYLIFSLINFTDGPVMSFMALSVLSFLCWVKLGERKFLWLSGLGLALASLTKYTSVPILLMTFIVWCAVLRKELNWSKTLELLVVFGVSLIPITFWVYKLSQLYGNIMHLYSSTYNLFPNNLLSILAFNLLVYAPYPFLTCGFAILSWRRQRLFDLDSKLLLIYVGIVFFFFMPMNTLMPYYRYLLPMAPAITVISARSLSKENESTRFLILFTQFLLVLTYSLVILLLRPF